MASVVDASGKDRTHKRPGELYCNLKIWVNVQMGTWCGPSMRVLSLDSRHSPEKPGVVVDTCVLRAREAGTEGSLRFAGQPV